MPGSGKSAISRCFDKLDSDSEIEKKYNLPLSQIVSSKTFEEFIEIEGNTIVDMLKSCKNKIIATGGSVVYSDHFKINLDNDLGNLLQVSKLL